jgi:hypothetical protein
MRIVMTVRCILSKVVGDTPHAFIAISHVEDFLTLINGLRRSTSCTMIHFINVRVITAKFVSNVLKLSLVDPPELLVLDSFNLENFRIGHCRLEIRLNFLPLM